VDDGARLRIDLDRNGLDAGDNVFNEEDGTGLRVLAADVTFPQTGVYDFEWVTLCTGADYGEEISVAAFPGAMTPIDPGIHSTSTCSAPTLRRVWR
jgi:hypothetical protein